MSWSTAETAVFFVGWFFLWMKGGQRISPTQYPNNMILCPRICQSTRSWPLLGLAKGPLADHVQDLTFEGNQVPGEVASAGVVSGWHLVKFVIPLYLRNVTIQAEGFLDLLSCGVKSDSLYISPTEMWIHVRSQILKHNYHWPSIFIIHIEGNSDVV